MFEINNLLIYSIEGYIYPRSQSMSCGLETPTAPTYLESKKYSLPMDVLKTSLDEYEQHIEWPVTHRVYWKPKLIFQVLNASSIVSMSVIPSNHTEKAILFVQKGILEKGAIGFFAPYLSEEQQEEWNAKPELPHLHQIQNEETIDQSLTGLDQKVFQDIKACLKYFLLDGSTQAIVLTYQNPAGEVCSLGWQKV